MISRIRRGLAIMAAIELLALLSRSLPAQQTRPAPVVVIATIDAYWTADLYAKDSGYVSDVKADIGDRLIRGQVLAVIDDPELQDQLGAAQATINARQKVINASDAAVRQAQAALETAKRQLEGLQAEQQLAQVTLKRQEELFSGKAATQQQLDEMRARSLVASASTSVGKARIASAEADLGAAEAGRSVAEAQVRVAAAEIRRLQTLLGYTKVVAPFDGVVTRRMISPGDLVQAATANRTMPLFTCQKLDVLRVFCDVPEASSGAIHPGDAADIQIAGAAGAVLHAKVTRIANSLDPRTRTMRAEIDLPNPDQKLLPGTYAQVTLLTNAGTDAAATVAR